jgi:hypothetical protein
MSTNSSDQMRMYQSCDHPDLQITDYRLPIGPIKVGRPRGANLGSMGNNRRHTVIMR